MQLNDSWSKERIGGIHDNVPQKYITFYPKALALGVATSLVVKAALDSWTALSSKLVKTAKPGCIITIVWTDWSATIGYKIACCDLLHSKLSNLYVFQHSFNLKENVILAVWQFHQKTTLA